MRGLRITAWAVAIATYVFIGLGALGFADAFTPIPIAYVPLIVVAFLMPATVGLLIAIHQPRNRIAWILLVGGLVPTLQLPFAVLLGEGWALQLDRALWPILYAWPIAVAFVFPNGRLLSPRWRWVALGAAVSFAGFITVAILDPEPFYGEDARVPNPMADNAVTGWLGSTYAWLSVPLLLGMLCSLVAGAVAIRIRLKRSVGIERLQTLWLAWSAALVPITLLVCIASGFVGLALGVTIVDRVVFPLLLLIDIAVAASVGIAVGRYRLYAIERLVNRTLVYAALTTLLISAFAGLTIGLGVLVGSGSEWVTAAATLVVAVAFLPLRRRIQELVDRRFSRARYQGVRRVRAFEDEVRDGRRAPEEISGVLAQALGDPRADLRFWLPGTGAFADAAGELSDLPDDDRARTDIDRDGVPTAVLLHDSALLDRRDLMHGVLTAAALSIEMARLRVEVRLQLAEVEASRVRIVEAGYEERRRLERDLHDGAQQRLVSLGVQVRRLQRTLPRDCRGASPRSRPRRRGDRSGDRRPPPDRRWCSAGAAGRRPVGRARRPGAHGADPGRRRRATPSASRPASRPPPTSSPARRSRTPSATRPRRVCRCAPSGRTGRCSSPSPTTGSAAPSSGAARGSPASRTASPPTAARSRS